MKLQIFSDLHTDVAPIKPITIGDDVDAVMVAGDTCQGVRPAFASLRRIVPERIPIIMTAGNHEFYRRCIKTEIAEAKISRGRRRPPGDDPLYRRDVVDQLSRVRRRQRGGRYGDGSA